MTVPSPPPTPTPPPTASPPITPAQTVGPFFGFALPYDGGERLVSPDAAGALTLTGGVLDAAGVPVVDALVEVWQADPGGAFPGDPGVRPGFGGFGRCPTDAHGAYRFVTVKPGPVPGADGRPQAPHLDVVIFARGLLKKAVTRVYFPDEAVANAADPVLMSLPAADAATLVASAGAGGGLVHDIHLSGERETVFFAL